MKGGLSLWQLHALLDMLQRRVRVDHGIYPAMRLAALTPEDVFKAGGLVAHYRLISI